MLTVNRRTRHCSPPYLSQHIMKSFTLVSMAYLLGAVASPQFVTFGSEQQLLGLEESMTSYDGFHLDLSAQRLVQMEGQKPMWMTELEKVSLFILPRVPFVILTLVSRSRWKLRASSSLTCKRLLLDIIHPTDIASSFSTETQDLGSSAHLRLQGKHTGLFQMKI